ncbi:sulfotransferase [Glutamicibacter sp. MNS18]|uniref:sulfotransferase family protein n=1 Tax=Glutamicibacter sp. MNS18 TaxID=2989817 RepID=UPI0022363808|nr:sulfotransferase [Glutamicibacter sp. MNS18]MCW4466157.1 sulfotransferase [Glutamicibacter sp. MNS18]
MSKQEFVVEDTIQHSARQLARTTLVGFGQATAGLRMQPGFIIAGAQRCATTSLFRMLARHPQVRPPILNKGIHFFDTADRFARGPRFYAGHFPLRRPLGHQRISGEASPYYLFHPLAMERIATVAPEAQVIVLLRDPVQRAFSAYKQEKGRGFETLPFEEALDREEERLAGEEARIIADPGYQSFAHQHFGYVARGRYTHQLQRAERALAPGKLTILDADAFFRPGLQGWDTLLERIGLEPWQPNEIIHSNARPGARMPEGLRKALGKTFETENEALVKYLGYTPSWLQ